MRKVRDRLGEFLAETWLILRESALSFQRDGCFDRSAALAFYCFLSLIPLLLLEAVVVTQVLRSSDRALEAVKALTVEVLPVSGQLIVNEVHALSLRKTWGLLTIVLLLWSASPLATGIRGAFQAIFRPEKVPPFFKAMAFDLVVIVGTLVAMLTFVLGKLAYLTVVPVMSPAAQLAAHQTRTVAVFLVLPLLLLLFYRVFVPMRVRARHLLAGSVITAILLSAVGPLFTMVLRYNPAYGSLTFGSLKAIFLLFLWVYYAFVTVLLGTEIIATMARREALIIRGLFTDPDVKPAARTLLNRFVSVLGAGEEIFREGDDGNALFHVLKGSVALTRAGRTVRVMKKGAFFGEMALLLNAKRTLSAAAVEAGTEVVTISRKNMEMVLKENPAIVLAVLQEMAARLKEMDETIEAGGGDAGAQGTGAAGPT